MWSGRARFSVNSEERLASTNHEAQNHSTITGNLYEQKGDIVYKKDLIRRTAEKMRENSIRKIVPIPKHVFYISDDEGNTKKFAVRKSDKKVLFTNEDVEAMLETLIEVISDAIKRGENVGIKGFGTLGLSHCKQRTVRHVETGEEIIIPERYIPRFSFGHDLRMCAKVYELSLKEKEREHVEPAAAIDDEDE